MKLSLPAFAVRNTAFTTVIFIMIIALGLTTILTMPRSEDPEVHAPTFPIIIVYPGATARDIEDRVVNPLEATISALDDIKRVRTNISDGVAVIQVEYNYNSNVDAKYQEIVREVNGQRSDLPADISSIEVRKFQPSDVNILQIALLSEHAPREKLQYYAEKLQDDLEKLSPLKKVDIFGLPNQQVRIELDLEKMAQMHLPLTSVTGALHSEMTSVPGGSIDVGHQTYDIKTNDYRSLDEVASTVVYSAGGKNVLLKDIGRVYFGYADDTYKTRLNGHRCIFVGACLKDKENISKAQQIYLPVLASFKKTLPEDIDLVVPFDQANNVNRRLSGLGRDFLIAILLVSITLLPLGGRSAIIVMISIPLSLAIGVVLLQLFGFNLNQLSIVGLVVALGLLVDDSIVVVENIERWMLEGHSRLDATLKATNQIGMAVLGCTVTLIIAFMPLAFLPEGAGDFIRSLPVAVMFCVLASMFVSLTITPFLASKVLKEHIGNPEGNLFMRGLKRIIHGSYARWLEYALNRPWLTIGVALLIFSGSIYLFKAIGFSLFPSSEKPQFLVNITAPSQTNLPYTDSITRRIESELKKEPEIKFFASNVGKGNPRIYYNESQENERSDYAQIFVQLDDNTPPARKLDLIQQLRSRWTPYPGAKVEVKNFEQGPPVIAPVEVRLFGDNLDTLRSLASRVETLLQHTKGTIYVTNPVSLLKSDIKVDINKEKAQMLGVPSSGIDQAVRMAVTGLNVGKFYTGSKDSYEVLVTRDKPGRPNMDAFKDLYVNNSQGSPISVAQVADLRLEASPAVIRHQEKRRVVSVQANVQKGFLVDGVLNDVIRQMNAMPLPPGYSYEMGGEIEARNNSFGGFGSIIILTVFLFVAVLILEFRTFKSTLIVLSVIPLGVVGASVALWLTGNTLSFVAIIGLIALAGIEVKNTILLVDFTNQLRAHGKSLNEAIKEAGEIRFLPIVLTSLTAIGGLIPIAISTNPLISPLAIVLIGGLISSTLLSRVVTPVVYKLMPPKVERASTGG
jgi:multidrug efflux pump subunit AcrB